MPEASRSANAPIVARLRIFMDMDRFGGNGRGKFPPERGEPSLTLEQGTAEEDSGGSG